MNKKKQSIFTLKWRVQKDNLAQEECVFMKNQLEDLKNKKLKMPFTVVHL